MPQCGCSGGSTGGGGETNPPVTVIRPDRKTTFVSEVEFRGLSITDKYEYDLQGNISKRVTVTGGVTRAYSYDTNKRLISVTENGVTQSISGYDALGNPSSYKGKTLTWTRGRMLASCGSDSYLYDMDGVRQEKTVNGVTHTYYTDGTKILAEKVGDKVFEYYYDLQGIVAFKYDGAVYYFKKNLMGDIDRIYDANKNLVAEYKYDAWGNHRVYTGTGIDITDNSSYNNSVAKLNPFRYRGYYYDTETGLYYLNSRYYDPSVGRFINADDISYIQPEQINGLNLFAYCGNNPVMNTDPAGHGWLDWLVAGLVIIGSAVVAVATAGTSLLMTGALAGIAIGGTVSVVDQVATTGDVDMNRFATDVVSSAISGALAATGLGAGMQILGNLAIGAGSALLYSGLSGEPITVESGISSLASGLMGGIFGGAGAKYISLGSNLMKDIVNKSFAQGKILPALLRSNLAIQTYNLIKKIIGIIS